MNEKLKDLKEKLGGEYHNIYNFAIIDTSIWYRGEDLRFRYTAFMPSVREEVKKYNDKIRNFDEFLSNQGVFFRKVYKPRNSSCFSTETFSYILANVNLDLLLFLLKSRDYGIFSFIFGETNISSKKKPTFTFLIRSEDEESPLYVGNPWFYTPFKIKSCEKCQKFLKEKSSPFHKIEHRTLTQKLQELSVKTEKFYEEIRSSVDYRDFLKASFSS